MSSISEAVNSGCPSHRISCIAPNVPSAPTIGTVMTDCRPTFAKDLTAREREDRRIDAADELASPGSDHAGSTPFRIRVIGMVVLQLLGPLDLVGIAVCDRDEGSVAAAVDRDHDRTPLCKFRDDRFGDAAHDLGGVERIGKDIVDLREILHPLALAPFDLEQSVAFLDCSMTLVDVDRQAEGTDHFVALATNDDVADAFDPMDAPVGPDATVIEAKRVLLGDPVRHRLLDHCLVPVVDVGDPILECPTEVVRVDTEEGRGMGIPGDRPGATVPRPFAHPAGCQRCLQAVGAAYDRL